jgi:hypothetical protein
MEPVFRLMTRRPIIVLLLLAGCAKSPSQDLQYIKQARSLAAEWALINQQANAGRLTGTYVSSMHRWLHDDLRTTFSSLARPDSPYGKEIQALLAEPQNAAPGEIRAHGEVLKTIEDKLESA